MTFSVNTNTASIAALASLRMTATQLTMTENQISTGKKISTASDDPAIYAISQGMNSQIAGLAGISSGLQFTAQVLSTASTQATSTSGLLSTLATTITEGQTNGLTATTLNNSINATLKQIDANANGATFQGVNLLSGAVGSGVTSTSVSAVQDLVGDKFSLAGSNATSSGLGLAGLNVAQAGLDLAVGATATPLNDSTGPAELTLISSAPDGTATTGTAQSPYVTSNYILNNAHGADAAVTTALATALGSTAGATATVTGGVLSMAGTFTTATNASNDTVYTDTTTGNTLTVGTDASGNSTYSVSTAVDSNGNTTAETNITSVETSSAETNALTNPTGVAPLQVDLLMTAVQNSGFGVTKDSTTGDLTVSGGNLNTTDPGNVSTIGTGTVSAVTGSDVALGAVNAAIAQMNTISSALGSSTNLLTGLQSTVSTLSDALTTGVGALTDADLSAESAKLTSLQTKQQLAIQSLSIANSQSSSIMSLFR